MIGVVLLVSALLGLGFMADFLSKPVLLGYINGTAVLIISSQLGKMFGLSITAQGFPERIREFVDEVPDSSWETAALSAVLLALALLLRIYLPRFPGALSIVVIGGLLSVSFDLKSHGIATVGHVASGLPSISRPNASFSDIRHLALPAVGLALVGFGDAIAIGRAFARKRGYEIDANQELAGLAAAQFAAGFSGAMPVGSSGSRTALADESGGRSRLVALSAAGLVAVVAAFAMPLIEWLPQFVLGVVVVAAAIGLIDVRGVWKLRRVRDAEFWLAVSAFAGVVLFGVLDGIVIAVAISIGVFVYRAVRPHDAVLGRLEDVDGYHDVERAPTAQTIPGLVVYRFDAAIFFPNALHFREQVLELVARTSPRPQVVDAERGGGHIRRCHRDRHAAGAAHGAGRRRRPVHGRACEGDAQGRLRLDGGDRRLRKRELLPDRGRRRGRLHAARTAGLLVRRLTGRYPARRRGGAIASYPVRGGAFA